MLIDQLLHGVFRISGVETMATSDGRRRIFRMTDGIDWFKWLGCVLLQYLFLMTSRTIHITSAFDAVVIYNSRIISLTALAANAFRLLSGKSVDISIQPQVSLNISLTRTSILG